MKLALSAAQHLMMGRMCQIAATQARIAYWQSMLSSGAYKDRNVHHGIDGPQLTEEEKRDDVLQTILRLAGHLQSMQDFHEESAAIVELIKDSK